jgi:hypothetical protein
MGTLSLHDSHEQNDLLGLALLLRSHHIPDSQRAGPAQTLFVCRRECSKGLFRRRADALERQGSIIIVVVVRFDCDTAACLWKGGNRVSDNTG